MSNDRRIDLLRRIAKIDHGIAAFEKILAEWRSEKRPTTTMVWEIQKLKMLHDKTMAELKLLESEDQK